MFCPPFVHPHDTKHYKTYQHTYNIPSVKSAFFVDFTLILQENLPQQEKAFFYLSEGK